MNAVIYLSFSNQSKTVAQRLSEQLGFPLFDLRDTESAEYENAVIVFPVHCQGLPKLLKNFLKTLKAKYITLIATYGRANPGNAIYEAARLCGNVIAAAYIPAKHTYCDGSYEIPAVPQSVIDKIAAPSYIQIPRRIKAPFAEVFPSARSRAIIKIKKSDACVLCNACAEVCPSGAIFKGKINNKCIRCLSCVSLCPQNALYVKQSAILKSYLKKPRCEKVIIYI